MEQTVKAVKLLALLDELSKLKIVKLSGSWARGEQTNDSDIDFWVKEESPVAKVKNIDKIKAVLERHGLGYTSCFPMSITTRDVAIMVEFSSIFPRYRKGVVNVMGIDFQT